MRDKSIDNFHGDATPVFSMGEGIISGEAGTGLFNGTIGSGLGT